MELNFFVLHVAFISKQKETGILYDVLIEWNVFFVLHVNPVFNVLLQQKGI